MKAKSKVSRRSDADPTTAYAKAVVAGEIVAGPHVRNACARHLRDLVEGPKRGLRWDAHEAGETFRFYEHILRLNGGEFEGIPFTLHESQKFIIGNLFGWKASDGYRRFRVAFIEEGKGNGKSPLVAGIGLKMLVADGEPRAEVYAAAPLALDTPVPTPTGWTTQGALTVGDKVFDECGAVATVTYLSPVIVNAECFAVEFNDGTRIIADANHRWLTEATNAQKLGCYPPKVRTTAEIAATVRTSTGRPNHRIAVAGAMDLPDVPLPIDPYVLGVWLGDGRSNRGAFCYHKDDSAVAQMVQDCGFEVSQMGSQNDTRNATIRGLRTRLRHAGLLDNKHVPSEYLRGSFAQRLALLQGLMDTDGTCTKAGECRFSNRESRLADAVYDLAAGLGLRPHIRAVVVTDRPHWLVSFRADTNTPVFRLVRKAQRQLASVAAVTRGRYIVSVTPTASVPVRCIEVDSSSHLYLVSRAYIATHNTKKDQAQILFRDAVAMVDQSPELNQVLERAGGKGKEWNIADLSTGSFFRTVASDDSQSGPRPHCALLDEVHEHKSGMMIEMMRAGTKGRRQAMIVMITNSGSDKQTVCGEYHDYGVRVCAGAETDDGFFAYICALDETDDPFTDPSCWIKANPLLGVSIKPKYLEEQIREARGMPSKQAIVRRLSFCEWTEADSPWISPAVWQAACQKYDDDLLEGRRCYGGLDLSSTTDMTAFALLFEPTELDPVWRLKCWFWIPSESIHLFRRYAEWRAGGWIEATPGAAINKLHVVSRLVSCAAKYHIVSIGYDRWRIEDIKSLLENEGVDLPLAEFGQGFRDMAPAVDEFERLLIGGEMKNDGNPVMNWNIGSAVIDSDPAGNRKLTKDRSTGRIDGVVAAVMAAGRSLAKDAEPQFQAFFV